jgi:hypothetical protein
MRGFPSTTGLSPGERNEQSALGTRDATSAGGRRMRMAKAQALTLLTLIATAACSSTEEAGEPSAPCPRTFIVGSASRMAVPPPSVNDDPQALRYVAALNNIRSGCRDADGAIEVDIGFDLLAQRGPALEGNRVSVTYFVATVGSDQTILDKKRLEAEIVFPEARQVAGSFEALTLNLPVAGPAEEPLPEIYVGLQLDPAELQATPPPLPE